MPFTFSGTSHDRLDRFFTVAHNALLTTHAVDQHVWMAPFHCQLVGLRETRVTASSQAGATVRPRKITDNSTPGAAASATVIELTAADMATDLTALTPATPDLVDSACHFKPGDKLALNYSATQTALAGQTFVFVFKRR